ncbi:MAG: cell wall hydrolase [Patescibacteria group bacterium]
MRKLFSRLTMLAATLALLGGIAAPALAWEYRIQPGDSLYSVARDNGISLDRLRAMNGAWSDLIYPGDRLEIPTEVYRNGDDTRAVELLARLIHAEAGGEPYTGQVAVGAVVMNRLRDPGFPATIAGNVFAPGEFESVSNGYIWTEPTAENYRAAEEAMAGWDPTGGARYFFNPAETYSAWMWSRPILTQIGGHVFSR